MKVILKPSGEVKNVSLGYAVNYLLPRGLAQTATDKNLAELAKNQVEAAAKKAESVDSNRQLSERLDGKVVEFKREAGKSGKIHGSITKKDIALSLKILKTNVELAEPIKKTGEYEIGLKFGASKAKVKVKVSVL